MPDQPLTDEEIAAARREVRARALSYNRNEETHHYVLVGKTLHAGSWWRRNWAVKRAWGSPVETCDELHARYLAGDPDVDEWETVG